MCWRFPPTTHCSSAPRVAWASSKFSRPSSLACRHRRDPSRRRCERWFSIPGSISIVARSCWCGSLTPGTKIRLCAGNEVYEVEALGALTPKPVVLQELAAGDVGFVIANIKRVADARMGDTIVEAARPALPLPGFEAIKPMVFAGLFPVNATDYELLRDALGKLQLNDAAFFYEPENSVALGF